MPVEGVYQQIRALLQNTLCTLGRQKLSQPTLSRLALLVIGIIRAKEVAPARVARALDLLGLSGASPESIERRLRRIENDVHIDQQTCVHPLARYHLSLARERLTLIVAPTYMKDRWVLVTIAVWYRGQALPLAWALWPHNQPLKGLHFWERMRVLLDAVAGLLPLRPDVVLIADRAFGSGVFTDMVAGHGWYFVIRILGQTRFRERSGRERSVKELVGRLSHRAKGAGSVFKKQGWRRLSVVAHWGRRHKSPLIVVSNMPPRWDLLAIYQQRYGIEALFRHLKSHGWNWEQSQVKSCQHWGSLLVGMALASWLALSEGSRRASELLSQPLTHRRSCPHERKYSLFTLGVIEWLKRLSRMAFVCTGTQCLNWHIDFVNQNWSDQFCSRYARTLAFGG